MCQVCLNKERRKKKIIQMSIRRIVLNSLCAAVCGGTVKNSTLRACVWSSDVRTFTTRQSFHRCFTRRAPQFLSGVNHTMVAVMLASEM